MSSVTGSARGDATSALAKVPRAERRGTTCDARALPVEISTSPPRSPVIPEPSEVISAATPPPPARAAPRALPPPRARRSLPARRTGFPRARRSRVKRPPPSGVCGERILPRARVAISALPRLATPSAIWPAAQSTPRPPASFPRQSIAPEDASLLTRRSAHLRQRSPADFAQATTDCSSHSQRHPSRAPRSTNTSPARASDARSSPRARQCPYR